MYFLSNFRDKLFAVKSTDIISIFIHISSKTSENAAILISNFTERKGMKSLSDQQPEKISIRNKWLCSNSFSQTTSISTGQPLLCSFKLISFPFASSLRFTRSQVLNKTKELPRRKENRPSGCLLKI